MKEFSWHDEIEVSWRGSVYDVKDARFVGVNVGAWVIGHTDVHLIWDGAVEYLGLSAVKNDHCPAKKSEDQENAASIYKRGMRDRRLRRIIGMYYGIRMFSFFTGGVAVVLRGGKRITGIVKGWVPHIDGDRS